MPPTSPSLSLPWVAKTFLCSWNSVALPLERAVSHNSFALVQNHFTLPGGKKKIYKFHRDRILSSLRELTSLWHHSHCKIPSHMCEVERNVQERRTRNNHCGFSRNFQYLYLLTWKIFFLENYSVTLPLSLKIWALEACPWLQCILALHWHEDPCALRIQKSMLTCSHFLGGRPPSPQYSPCDTSVTVHNFVAMICFMQH